MPEETEILILAKASEYIGDYLRKHPRSKELQKFRVIQERIRAIEHVISTWSKAGGRLA